MHSSKLEAISKLELQQEGQKPKINSEGESTLPTRIQKSLCGHGASALYILPLSASLLAS